MHEITFGLIIAVGGSLINFASTKIYNHFSGGYKNFLWRNKYPKLKNIAFNCDFDDLKKRVRILVIDDEDSFPINLFQSDGYSIQKWGTVNDYTKLESGFYDIIVLDIKGVALHISEDDGLGVLESLKKRNPAQIIIAYSQHSFDLSKAKFWELADEKIAKPSDYLKMKAIIDNLVTLQFKPSRYIDHLHKLLRQNNFEEQRIIKLDSCIVKTIKQRRQMNWNDALGFTNISVDLANQIKTIGNTILKFYQ